MTTAATLPEDFDDASARYDLLTSLNPGYHAALRDAARRVVEGCGDDPLLLDLGCGSGLSTQALVDEADSDARVLGIDASLGMLRHARRKTWPAGVAFRYGLAQDLSRLLADEDVAQVDGILAAYLLRNVPEGEREAVVRSLHDALAPGRRLVIQEYSVAGRPLARVVWTLVVLGIVLPLATVLRGNPRLYRYLWRSVLAMESVASMENRLRAAGFVDVSTTTGPGWQRGILHTISARRPEVGA